jgi:hypothetical protein
VTDDAAATEVARRELLPLLETLRALARDAGRGDQEAFFARLAAGVRLAREDEDLAGPLMDLATSAFRGFAFDADVALLLDRALAVAQALSATLSAPDDVRH